jgi:hypothetical protein
VVACDRWYEFYTGSHLLATGLVKGHTSPCSQKHEVTPDALEASLMKHLQESNFDVTTLPVDLYETLPYGNLTRAQAAVFILRTLHGGSYTPPQATGLFLDVPASDRYAAWVEQLSREGLLDACSDAQKEFCPEADLTLADAAKLALEIKNGGQYLPSLSTVQSSANACSSRGSPWIGELQKQGILMECAADTLVCCPEAQVDIRQLSRLLSYALKKP